MPDTFVSLADAAAQKGVHYQTVRRAIARGDLKAIKVGGGVMIANADLDGWQPQYKHAPNRPRRDERGSAVGRGAIGPTEPDGR